VQEQQSDAAAELIAHAVLLHWWIAQICRKAGLPVRYRHTLRHSLRIRAALFGVNPWRLHPWLGHSSAVLGPAGQPISFRAHVLAAADSAVMDCESRGRARLATQDLRQDTGAEARARDLPSRWRALHSGGRCCHVVVARNCHRG
jgi:hypothetical protein